MKVQDLTQGFQELEETDLQLVTGGLKGPFEFYTPVAYGAYLADETKAWFASNTHGNWACDASGGTDGFSGNCSVHVEGHGW